MGWVVYEVTGSGALLGAVLGVRAVPMILLAPLSGVRRRCCASVAGAGSTARSPMAPPTSR